MNELQQLLSVKEEERNFSWEEKFFKAFSQESVKLLSEDPQQGPDGWPYLVCETVPPAMQDKTELVQKLFQWLAMKGIGLVVNPRRTPYPDYVFSYGMIWNFRETGYFIMPSTSGSIEKAESTAVEFDNNQIYTGTPTEQYLPKYVREVLKDFFKDQMVFDPKVLMISKDQKNYDLCFSIESLGNPPQVEHAGIAEAISWFLPTHYSLVLISEKNLPPFERL